MNGDPYFSERPPGESLREPSFRMSTRQFGVVLLFASLSVLFGATILGYLLTRVYADVWRTPDMPSLPLGLLGSTFLLVCVSGAAEYSLACARQNRFESLKRALKLTMLFAGAFLIGQAFNWAAMLAGFQGHPHSLYAFTFYLLTGLHAAHVLAGFVPLGLVLARAGRKEYTSSRHEGVKFCVQYWHFLGVIWVVLVAALYFGSRV